MIEFGMMTAPNDRHFVRHLRQVLEQIRHFDARFTAAAEGPLAGQKFRFARFGKLEIQIRKARRQRLSRELGEHWFVVKRINLTRSSVHKERNHRFRSWNMGGQFGGEWIIRRNPLSVTQIQQGERANPHAGFCEHRSPSPYHWIHVHSLFCYENRLVLDSSRYWRSISLEFHVTGVR